MALSRRGASVAGDGEHWNVPYPALQRGGGSPKPRCTLAVAEALGRRLIRRHTGADLLAPGWRFGFDFALSRAGVCRYREKRIELSVNYCLRAAPEDVEDTILHEIAHALVGPEHDHDEVWRAAARLLGSTGERCHRTPPTLPRWLGVCPCGQRWTRQRLSRRIRSGRCASCDGPITWRRNDASAPAPCSPSTTSPGT